MTLPSYITHYHLPERPPLLNLSELPEPDLAGVIDGLRRERRAGKHHRAIGSPYMGMRRQIEARLRELFIAAGGKPERAVPHYFVLGACRWFEALAPGMRNITLPLDSLPGETTSFTYPDSFVALGAVAGLEIVGDPMPYHGRVFRMHELPGIVQRYGLPDDTADEDYSGYHQRPFEKFIEVQIWSDEPVRHLLR